MPLKTLQPTVYPETLLDSPPLGDDACAWFVFQTRPRAEKVLAERLHSRGLSFYLHLERRVWRKNGRVLTSYLPLFPGYLFFRGDLDQRRQAQETNLIANVLTAADQDGLFVDLQNVRRAVQAGKPLAAERRLAPGTPVVIRSGSLAGIEGVVVRQAGHTKIVVAVRFLQQGVSLEIEGWMLEPNGAPAADGPDARRGCVAARWN